ncbi:fimbrial protein [Comamonas sp. GB3 AK4-5]|uniref:fimbrial protein n=1 Tax=Comamonas sp. GB3 AK4-5 TaxID=3231487 RepID=UPI00351EAF74
MNNNHKYYPILKCVIILFTFFIIIPNALLAHAQAYCSMSGKMTSDGWKMSSPGTDFYNGQVIGSTRASVTYNMPVPQNLPIVTAGSPTAETSQYNAIPMPMTPGVGVRVKWGGGYSPYNINVTYQAPIGTILTRRYWQDVFRATSSYSFPIIFYYNYEIIVIDKDKYKGGKLIITDSTSVTAITATARPGMIPQSCGGGFINLMTAVTNELNVPELPEPAAPTCASADITLNTKMKSVNSSQVASYGSSRNSGTAGELPLRLIGRNCPKGTVIKAYFTDARSPSATNDYLNSSNQSVGVRLYYDQDQTPIKFGPTPNGSTLPTRSPIIEGPATNDNSTLYIPITAQYVRRPGVTAGDLTAGDMKAATTVTFIYD